MNNSQFQELYQVETDPADMVVRSDRHVDQFATVSFGPVWPASKFANALDVVNYYKPNPKNQTYLPENSFVNSQGRPKGHMGGESTFRGGSVNNNRQGNTQTNNYEFDNVTGDGESVDSDKDTVVPEGRGKGLFEVPFDVYSMPRLITPFKGFSKIVTPRAVRLMSFTETEEGKLMCKLDKNSLRILQKQIGDLNVVSVSFVGDPKSGKSFLGSLLVGKDNASFNMSESYIDPNNMLTNGSVWAYVAVYHEKHAYVFLDFEGLEHSEKNREKMLLFAFSTSNLVFCNVKYSLMAGIHNSVSAMIELTKKAPLNEVLGEESTDKDENEFLELLKDRGSRLLTRSYETKHFNELSKNTQDSARSVERRELWNAPIVQFVFRDCSGFVKCIDDRIFTPETLVEQGLFENYLDPFDMSERDPNFKNEMLDAFEVFTNRKYISLPHPILSTHPYSDNDYSDNEGLNLTEFFVKLLSSDKNDFRRLTRFGYDDFTLNANLSTIFHEKLDQLKSLLYHDTLNYALAHTQVNGRMFGEYLKKLAQSFNSKNSFKIEDLNEMLSSVFLGENGNVLKQSLLKFLRHVREKVAPKLPVDSKSLLNMVISAKFTSLNHFESNSFGTPDEYKGQLDELSETLEDLIRKLENKNKSLMTVQIANYIERKESPIISSILNSHYTVNDLNDDLSKLKKSLNLKFTDSDLVTKVLARTSQNLVRIFNDTHPETFVHNLSYSKSSSIEETFQSLNSDIISITSNLKVASKVNGKFPPPVDSYPVEVAKFGDFDAKEQNDKFDFALEDNTLVDHENEGEPEEEESETDGEVGENLNLVTPVTGEQPTGRSGNELHLSDTEQETSTPADIESEVSDDTEQEYGYESGEVEEQNQNADSPDSEEDSEEDKEFDVPPKQELPVEPVTEQGKLEDEESWPSSDSSKSSSDDFSMDLRESVYDETPVRSTLRESKNDEVVEVMEYDFALEDIEEPDYSSNISPNDNNFSDDHYSGFHNMDLFKPDEKSPKSGDKKPTEKLTLLRKIFERSAEKYLQSRR